MSVCYGAINQYGFRVPENEGLLITQTVLQYVEVADPIRKGTVIVKQVYFAQTLFCKLEIIAVDAMWALHFLQNNFMSHKLYFANWKLLRFMLCGHFISRKWKTYRYCQCQIYNFLAI